MPAFLRATGASVIVAIGLLVCNRGGVLAQAYPVKPVRVIFPFPPGGPTDLLGRAVAQKLSDQTGQQFIADTRPGAGGNLGLELAAKAPPDGYTIVCATAWRRPISAHIRVYDGGGYARFSARDRR